MSHWFGRGAKAGQAAPEAITLTLPIWPLFLGGLAAGPSWAQDVPQDVRPEVVELLDGLLLDLRARVRG